MVTENIDIVVRDRGTRTVSRNLDQVGNRAGRASRGVELLRRALLALGGFALIRGIVRLADSFTTIQNRLKVVTGATAETAVVTEELFQIARRTRQEFRATSEIYARSALATRDLGISQKETLQFTESLNQAVILSGASAQEASAGVIQLSQGLASGTLRGDELRSVLEQLPVVADVIAESLGITRGRLRELGEEGKISAENILTAFREARSELAERFAKTVPTISQSFVILRNALTGFIGEIDAANGVSKALSRTIIALGDNINTVARAIGGLAISFAILAGPRAIGAAIRAMKAFTVLLVTNPFTAILAAIGLVIGQLVAFSDQIQLSEDRLANLADFGTAAFEEISTALSNLTQTAEEELGFLSDIFSDSFDLITEDFETILRETAREIDALVGIFKGGADAIAIAFNNVPGAIERVFVRSFNFVSRQFTNLVNNVIDGLNLVIDFSGGELIKRVEAFEFEVESASENIGAKMLLAISNAIDGSTAVEDALDRTLARAEQIAAERSAEEAARKAREAAARGALDRTGTNRVEADAAKARLLAFQELAEAYKLENELLKLNAVQRQIATTIIEFEDDLKSKLTQSERELVEQLVRENFQLQSQANLLEELKGPQEELLRRQGGLKTLFDEGRISAEQFTEAMRSLNVEISALDNSFSGGLRNGFDRIIEKANELGQDVSNFVVGAFDQLTDAIVNFAATGQLNIRQFFATLFQQLLKLAAQQLFIQLLGSFGGGGGFLGAALGSAAGAAGGAGGGGGGGGGPVGFRTGGSFTVGGQGGADSQLVAFKATPGERVDVRTPAQQRQSEDGGGRPSEPSVNLQIINQTDPSELLDVIGSNQGERKILNVIRQNSDAVARIVNR